MVSVAHVRSAERGDTSVRRGDLARFRRDDGAHSLTVGPSVTRRALGARSAQTCRTASGTHRFGATGSGGDRGHPDGDENAGQLDAEFGHIAGGWIGGERAGVLLVQSGEIGRIGQQNANLHDVVVSGAACFQDRQAVGMA